MAVLKNPFVTGGYISPEYFCDREAETDLLLKYLQNGNNVTLISTRRMGKSGLIWHCFGRPEVSKSFQTFFVDIYATKSLGDFVFMLSKSIFNQLKSSSRKLLESFLIALKSLRPDISFDANGVPSIGLSIGDIRKPEVSLEEIFQFLKAASPPCIVAIDELQQLQKYPEANAKALLRTFVQQCPQVRFIFSGSQRHVMSEMFTSAARPFFASASLMYLEAIDRHKYVEFAQKHFRNGGREITAETVGKIYDAFEGITWYIQKILNFLYGETERGECCTAEAVESAIDFIVASSSYAYSENMFLLPDKQSKLLIAIAKEKKVLAPTSSGFVRRHHLASASSVQAALNGLLEKELLTRSDNAYSVYDKFLEKWLNDSY
ncbi:MAG: ATP-binding protein [Prevotellaceae bacterium]|jgi:AAA+ ATPase superfamily predicted ATPase|nr:ATP-binding protein [Prevotellaceae bacterium]